MGCILDIEGSTIGTLSFLTEPITLVFAASTDRLTQEVYTAIESLTDSPSSLALSNFLNRGLHNGTC